MTTSPWAAVILAAGFSSRMGALKPLMRVGAGTILDRVVSTYRSQADIYVVVGHRSEDVRRSLTSPDVNVIENPDYERGMLSSIQAGLRSVPRPYEGFLVHPVDIPLVSRGTVATLIEGARASPGSVIYATFGGKRGHPVLIPARLVQRILKWSGGDGLKGLLSKERDFAEITVPDWTILFDLDTPGDYDEMVERAREEGEFETIN